MRRSSRPSVVDRALRVAAPFVERAVVDPIAVDPDPLKRQQRDGRRHTAATGRDQLLRGMRGVDPGITDEPGDRIRSGPQPGRAVDQLLIGQAARAGYMPGVRGAFLAQEQVAGAGVDKCRAAGLSFLYLG